MKNAQSKKRRRYHRLPHSISVFLNEEGREPILDNVQWEAFCRELAENPFIQKKDAAYNAGYAKASCGSAPASLLKRAKVRRRIKTLLLDKQYDKINTKDIVREVSKIAFADIRKVIKKSGQYDLSLKELNKIDGALISEVSSYVDSDENLRFKVKLHSKADALEKLMRMYGLFEKDNEQKREVIKIVPPHFQKGDKDIQEIV